MERGVTSTEKNVCRKATFATVGVWAAGQKFLDDVAMESYRIPMEFGRIPSGCLLYAHYGYVKRTRRMCECDSSRFSDYAGCANIIIARRICARKYFFKKYLLSVIRRIPDSFASSQSASGNHDFQSRAEQPRQASTCFQKS